MRIFTILIGLSVIVSSAMAWGFVHAQGNNKISPADMLKMETSDTDPYWKNAQKEVYKSVPQLVAQDQEETKNNKMPKKLMRGPLNRKEIAITFDDGPHPQFTPKILDILRKNRDKATFFLVGMMAEKYPELVKAEVKDGHSVGNHTYHHVSLPKIPAEYVAVEIQACTDVLKNAGVKSPHLFRPPGGDYTTKIARIANNLGYTLILWTDDPGDYNSPGTKIIINRLLGRLDNGGIILIHDGVQETVDALPDLLKAIRERGFTTVTIDDYLKHKGGNTVPSPVRLHL